MSQPSFENLLFSVENKIAIISFNRPKALNALNRATLMDLRKALLYVEACSSGRHGPEVIDVVILTGAGEKSFVAGADILEMKDLSTSDAEAFARLGQSVTRSLELLQQPVIAAVNGFALGGGCEFAMACDFILASENASFGQPEVALGLIPGFGGTVRLAKYIGLQAARELIYTGRKINAAKAKELGLVSEVVSQADLLPRAKAIAEEIMKNSPLAVAKSKKLMNQISHMSMDDALREEALLFSSIFATSDQREGTTAFVEKRKANFKGE